MLFLPVAIAKYGVDCTDFNELNHNTTPEKQKSNAGKLQADNYLLDEQQHFMKRQIDFSRLQKAEGAAAISFL
jgi:hypothetical protein